jgi:phosphatidate cytidylyltransferase
MKRVLTAVVLVPFVLLLVFRAPLWLFALAVAGIIVLALHEYLAISEAAGLKPFHWLTYIMALLPFVLAWGDIWRYGQTTILKVDFSLFFLIGWQYVLMAASVVFGIPLVFRKDLKMGLASSATSVFGLIFIALSLAFLVCMRGDSLTKPLIIFVLFSVWAGDIAAYYVGRSFGRHKLAPVVSPNKSWEGAVASVVASLVVAILVFHFRDQIENLFSGPKWLRANLIFPPGTKPHFMALPWAHVLGIGILTNVAAQFGDLFESALKRGAGVKDSGTLLPGHGGVLDRIDALLFAIPVVWYYATLTGFLRP